jgi:F-type H+-transporting ATPase subunit b
MEFPPDIAFVLQIALFLALWIILKYWLFDPVLRVLQLRRERTTGQLQEAERLSAETERMRQEYTRGLEAARVAGREEVATIRSAADREEQRIFEAARSEATQIVEEVRSSVAQELEAARSTMARYAAELSVEAAEKILSRSVR